MDVEKSGQPSDMALVPHKAHEERFILSRFIRSRFIRPNRISSEDISALRDRMEEFEEVLLASITQPLPKPRSRVADYISESWHRVIQDIRIPFARPKTIPPSPNEINEEETASKAITEYQSPDMTLLNIGIDLSRHMNLTPSEAFLFSLSFAQSSMEKYFRLTTHSTRFLIATTDIIFDIDPDSSQKKERIYSMLHGSAVLTQEVESEYEQFGGFNWRFSVSRAGLELADLFTQDVSFDPFRVRKESVEQRRDIERYRPRARKLFLFDQQKAEQMRREWGVDYPASG